jgi:SRSO17 transposase
MRGLFQSERANMLRMSEVNEVDHQSMQHMLTEGCVDWQGFGRQIAQEANALLGGTDAVLIFDESGFAKKGEASAGVARQWNGRLGKVDNCQVGVFATLCRGDMATLIDARLYRRNVSLLNIVFGRRKANVAWPITKSAAGMHGIIIWHW